MRRGLLGFRKALAFLIGWITRPWLLKKPETSLPWAASRAIASAEIGLVGLRVFFILE
jgi:hypothetical protein